MQEKYIEEARSLIDVLGLVDVLERHALGDIKMTSSQVSAALALLKKVMPDIPSSTKLGESKDKKLLSHEEALKELDK